MSLPPLGYVWKGDDGKQSTETIYIEKMTKERKKTGSHADGKGGNQDIDRKQMKQET